jgi:serine/threonine protein kinase
VSGEISREAADPLVGQTINDTYVIQQRIGCGGMGDVYKAVHNKLDAAVALKIVKPALLAHPAMVHRFEREARAASRLHHPNVVAVTDFGQSKDGMLFMVMEYVAGKSLAQVIAEDAPLPDRRVVHIGAQILSALAEAHANHILHRDLKPENVMIERRRSGPDSVKVLDFGIAKVLGLGAAASTLTQAGLVCGTPGYMSPEQLRGGDVDARSDLFSLGVVLYEMLTHKLPFEAQTPMEMLHKHLSEPIRSPGERRGRPVSPELEALVLQALAPDRDERPAGADEMREALLAAERSLTVEDVAGRPFATEVLPRGSASRPGTPQRATRTRSQGATGGGATSSSRTSDPAAEGATTPAPRAAERSASRTAVPRRDSAPGSGATAAARGGTTTGPGRTPAATSGRGQPFEKRVEERLASLLGPVASRLVRRFAAGASSLPQACEQLAAFIPSAADRKAFLAWCSAELKVAASPRERRTSALPSATPVAAAAWDPAVLDRARRDLATYVGPLARIIVRRVCPRAHDPRELYELLAREIPGDADRDAFRRLGPPPGEQ